MKFEIALGSGILIVALTLIEITPIKINPWSWIAGKIGKALNRDLVGKIDTLEEKITSLETKIEQVEEGSIMRDIVNSRNRILQFGDDLCHGINYSKEHFEQILLDITNYNDYCATHKEFKNHVTEHTTRVITRIYEKNLENNTFL